MKNIYLFNVLYRAIKKVFVVFVGWHVKVKKYS